MFKFVILGVWVVIVVLIVIYFFVQMVFVFKVDEVVVVCKVVEEMVWGELISFFVIEDGVVKGYFFMWLFYVVDKVKVVVIYVFFEVMIMDEFYILFVGDKMIDLEYCSSFDVVVFCEMIKEVVNKCFGQEVVFDVLIEQIDYLLKEDFCVSMV